MTLAAAVFCCVQCIFLADGKLTENLFMKVLILSTGTGEGHNSAAKAVKEQFEKRGIPCELADVLNFASDKAGAYGRRITSGARSGRKRCSQERTG